MDDEEIERLLRQVGLELPEVEDDPDAPLPLDALDDGDRERTPRDWRQEWEREWDDDSD